MKIILPKKLKLKPKPKPAEPEEIPAYFTGKQELEKCARCMMAFSAPADFWKFARKYRVPVACPQTHVWWFTGTVNLPSEKRDAVAVKEKKKSDVIVKKPKIVIKVKRR